MSDDNQQTAGDTVGQMGDALKKDAEQTGEDIKDATDWVKDKARDASDAVQGGK